MLEGEVRRLFGNNPDVSKALRALAEQGEGRAGGCLQGARSCRVGGADNGTGLLGEAEPHPHPHPRSTKPPAGKVVRGGGGGRGTPFSYAPTAKGRSTVGEARQKLEEDAELLRSGAAAAAAAAGEAAGGDAGGGQDHGAAGEGAAAE